MGTTPAAQRMQEIPRDECLELLKSKSLGRLAYVIAGRPRMLPLNYGMHQATVLLRIGYGELLDAVHEQQVAFEVDHAQPQARSGWSVVVHGIAEEIWRTEELSIARELQLQPWAPGNRDHYVRIMPASITGRRIE